jgi:hypothetical protein
MRCRKRKRWRFKGRFLCKRCRRFLHRRRRRQRCRDHPHPQHRPLSLGAHVNNEARVDGPVSGLINIIVQVPVNTGDATSLNDSNQNSLSNVL